MINAIDKRTCSTLGLAALTFLLLTVGIACARSPQSPPPTATPIFGEAGGSSWIVPDAYDGLCVSDIPIEYKAGPDFKEIGIIGSVPDRAIIKGWLQTVPTVYFDVKATVPEEVGIPFSEFPSIDLGLYGDEKATGYPLASLICLPPSATNPSPSPLATPAPERGVLSVKGLKGYECYTGSSSAYWDDARVVLSLRVENIGSTRSMKIWLRVSTDRGGPVSKGRGLENLTFSENTGTYGENDPTSLTFNGISIRPGEVKTLRWSADYFWAPDSVDVELWNGEPGLGEGQQGSATYVLSSDSPSSGLRSCARY